LDGDEGHDWLTRFESLGANCEFGFVLRAAGIQGSALLRWSEVFKLRTVTALIERDFAGIYEWENLRPFNAGMMRDDGCDVAWHTLIKSELIDPGRPPVAANFRFATSEVDRRRIWAIERKRVAFLASQLRAAIAAGGWIFVHRVSVHDRPAPAEIAALFAALNHTAPNKLLVVTACGEGEAEGLEVLAPGLLTGRVDRFAPGSRAKEVSLDSWIRLCRAAANA
jgi:hypothetical protein